MFAKHTDSVMPSVEGVDSLASMPRLCHPHDLVVMRSRMALQSAMDKAQPGIFRVMKWSAGAAHPWFQVEARWDGKSVDESALDISGMVMPLAVRFGGLHDGMFMWDVEAPKPDWMPEKPEPKTDAKSLVPLSKMDDKKA